MSRINRVNFLFLLIFLDETTKKNDPSIHQDIWSDCEIQDIIEEIAFQHMDHIKAVFNPMATYIGTLWFIRWLVFVAIATIWYESTRTIYIISSILNATFIGLTVVSYEAYYQPDAMLILAEEIIIFVWHLLQLLLFFDLESGGNYSSTIVWILVILIFLCFISTILIEFALIYFSLVPRPTVIPEQGGKQIQLAGNRTGVNTNEASRSNFQQLPTQKHGQSVPQPGF